MEPPEINAQASRFVLLILGDHDAIHEVHVPGGVCVNRFWRANKIGVPRLQRGRSRWLDSLDEDNDLLEASPQVGTELLFRRITVTQRFQLFLGELPVPHLFGKPSSFVLSGVVATMPLQRLSRGKRLATCWTSTALSLAHLVARLALPRPGPPTNAKVFFEASATLSRSCRAEEISEVCTTAASEAVFPGTSITHLPPPGVGVRHVQVADASNCPRPLAQSTWLLVLLLAARAIGCQRTPSIDAVHHDARHGKQEGGAELIVRLQKPHLCRLKSSNVALLYTVAANMGLHQGVLRSQIANAEHEIVRPIDAANDGFLTAEYGTGPRLWSRNALENDADEQGADDQVQQQL
mmetsp:Transcript_27656/g.62287  ORF Transcript_27656/g.62287 Transcript_27656/m.62287 type:complete len:351 (-) Transcript_27656:336-1388(-)